MYYLGERLGMKKTAAVFCLASLGGAWGLGNFVQVNSIALPLSDMGIPAAATGIVYALITALVVFGGAKRIAQVCSAVVPVMAALYLLAATVIICLYLDRLGPALGYLLSGLLKPSAFTGGLLGAMVTGFARGILATDAGTGIVPVLQAEARSKHPVIDGIIALSAPFLVMVVCTLTTLVLLVTGAFEVPGLVSTTMVSYAFAQGLGAKLGPGIVFLSLFLFGLTTTLAWGSCVERVTGYLFGLRRVRLFQYLYVGMLPLGAILRVDFAWVFADIAIMVMLLTNLIGVGGLAQEVLEDTRDFFADEERTRQKALN